MDLPPKVNNMRCIIHFGIFCKLTIFFKVWVSINIENIKLIFFYLSHFQKICTAINSHLVIFLAKIIFILFTDPLRTNGYLFIPIKNELDIPGRQTVKKEKKKYGGNMENIYLFEYKIIGISDKNSVFWQIVRGRLIEMISW